MHLGLPARSLVRTSHGPVLVALAGTTGWLTASEIARISEGRTSLRSVHYALADLVDDGIVSREEIGRSARFALNRDHVAADVVVAMAGLRQATFDRLRGVVASWCAAPWSLIVFGPFARGDGDRASDIDLFVVRPRAVADDDEGWRAQLADLSERVERWTGNVAAVVEYGEAELTAALWRREPLLTAVASEGVVVAGRQVQRPPRARRAS